MQFLYGHWLKLPLQTRAKIANQFGIIKKGSTEVFNNEVTRDGYLIPEIEAALNIDAIQKYLVSDSTDYQQLWDQMVLKVENRLPKPWCDSCDSKGVRHKKICPKAKK